MPRTSMSGAQVSATREKILDTAADIISETGFQSLSMRRIGARVGMTAANLYNYYSNKDEINIAIRMRAGRMPSWSRYLATVLRAILTPSAFR